MDRPAPTKRLPGLRSLATTFVVLVWVGMLAWAGRFIATHAPLFPILDDKNTWRTVLPPFGELTWSNLWEPHNEHRIPLPRLVYYCLYWLTGDLRPGLYLQLGVLGLLALGMILLARRLRGSTSFADAFFPLVWLHTGNSANLLSGFQLALTLPTALVSTILATAVVSARRPRTLRALACGLSLAALPLCGGAGMIQVPALAAWVAWTGWRGRRSADPAKRHGSRILLTSVLACAAFAAMHAWGYALQTGKAYGTSGSAALSIGSAMLALGVGPYAQSLWPWSGAIVVAILIATVARLGVGVRREPRQSFRTLGMLASIAAIVCLVGSVVVSRSDIDWPSGAPLRYVTLTTPLLCCAYFAWELYGGRVAGVLVPAAMASFALLALPSSARIGAAHGDRIRGEVAEFERKIATGAGPADLLEYFSSRFRGDPRLDLGLLRFLAAEGRPPFDEGRGVPATTFDFPSFRRRPSRVEFAEPVVAQFVRQRPLTRASAGTRIHLELRPGDATVSGSFGIPSNLLAFERFGDVRVRIDVVPRDGPARTLLDRTLRPATVESDRELQPFALKLPADGAVEIVLVTERIDELETPPSRVFWSDVAIE